VPFVAAGSSVLFALRCIKACRNAKPEILWANDLPTLPAAVAIRWLAGGVLVYDSHEVYTERVTSRPFKGVWRGVERRVEKLLLRSVDQIITVSDGAAEYLNDLYQPNVAPLVIRSIPDASDSQESLNRSLRADAGLADTSIVIVYTGVVTHARGVDLVIDAIRLIDNLAVHLVVVGYGQREYIHALQARAVAASVRDRVHFLEPVPSDVLVEYVATADVAVIPGRPVSLNSRVALPNKLFEALAAGLPLVVNDKPEISRFVKTHGVGVVTDCESPRLFAEALERVIGTREQWRGPIEDAQEATQWRHEAERLQVCLEDLLVRDRN